MKSGFYFLLYTAVFLQVVPKKKKKKSVFLKTERSENFEAENLVQQKLLLTSRHSSCFIIFSIIIIKKHITSGSFSYALQFNVLIRKNSEKDV